MRVWLSPSSGFLTLLEPCRKPADVLVLALELLCLPRALSLCRSSTGALPSSLPELCPPPCRSSAAHLPSGSPPSWLPESSALSFLELSSLCPPLPELCPPPCRSSAGTLPELYRAADDTKPELCRAALSSSALLLPLLALLACRWSSLAAPPPGLLSFLSRVNERGRTRKVGNERTSVKKGERGDTGGVSKPLCCNPKRRDTMNIVIPMVRLLRY